MKPEASSRSPTGVAGAKHLNYLLLFLVQQQGAGSEVAQPGFDPWIIWDASTVGSGLASHITVLASQTHLNHLHLCF